MRTLADRSGIAAGLLALACLAGPAPADPPVADTDATAIPKIDLRPAFTGLEFERPVYLCHDGVNPDRLYVLEQYGRILAFDAREDVSETTVFLDLRDPVYDQNNEEGLLGLAFHPDYATNGRFYVYYSANEPRRGVIAEFTRDASDPDRADPASFRSVLEVDQPWGNHNGATVLFGPDGMLYVSLGDGGAANDPHGNGQNLGTLLGSIIRIDVDRRDEGLGYAIPADNPFVGTEGARGEIWAYGLRNVWRMSFDRETGELWAGDVGQNRFEEIDLIVRGGNYGWNLREGRHPFRENVEAPDDLIDPIAEYGRREGISVTGGAVYRGTEFPDLRGVYLWGDYFSGRIWGLRRVDGKVVAEDELFDRRQRPNISSFGEAADGTLYVVTFDKLDRRGTKGRLYRIVVR